MGIQTLIILAIVYYYAEKVDRLNIDLDVLDAEYDAIYSAYCNISELAHQYKELAGKATDEAELYKDAYDSEHSAIHYELDRNEELEAEIKRLRNVSIIGESKDMQYESSGWHIDPWGSSKQTLTKEEWQKQWDANFNTEGFKEGITENQTPYVNPWSKPNINSIYGHTPYNQD
jgi:hypothetical protein